MIVCESLEDLPRTAAEIIREGNGYDVWLFEGNMGAGKTTLIKAICLELGVTDTVNSPTFSLVNEYQNIEGDIFYHFDFYRIKNEAEAMDIGIDEYFYSGNLCFVEWASLIPNLLPDSYVTINIQVNKENTRSISITKYGKSV